MDARLVSITSAVRWLEVHGVSVHENTIRHWIKRGHLAVARRNPGTAKTGRRAELFVPLESLERIAACPCCSHRGSTTDWA